MRLLLVDDHEDLRNTYEMFMSRKGHTVAQAADAPEALSLCESNEFDVAVVDMNMPGLTGIELLDLMKARAIETEVVILTGSATIHSAVEAMKRGAADFLCKPVGLEELEQRCLEACQKRESSGHLLAVRGEAIGDQN